MKKIIISLIIFILVSLVTFAITGDTCLQETANEATACGGLNTGKYSYNPAFWTNPTNVFDGDWTTKGVGVSIGIPMYINYTKPVGTFSNSLWGIRDGQGHTNLSLPINCWEQTPLQFKAESSYFTGNKYTRWYCQNGTDWQRLRVTANAAGNEDVYEENILWKVEPKAQNKLSINNNGRIKINNNGKLTLTK